jgi:WD40 repeat protein
MNRLHGCLTLCACLVLAPASWTQTASIPADKPTEAKPDTPAADPLPAGAVARLGAARWSFAGVPSALTFAPDGKLLAAAATDGSVRLFDTATGKEVRTMGRAPAGPGGVVPATGYATQLAFSPDGKSLGLIEANQRVRIVDPSTGKDLRQIAPAAQSGVLSFAFSPDGKTVATAGRDKLVRLWEVASGNEVGQLEGHQTVVSAVAFAADGKTLVSGSDDLTIRLWDVTTRKESRSIEGHRDAVKTLALSADGKRLASGSNDGTVRVWDLATGDELCRFEAPRQAGAVRGQVSRIFLSDDGTTLIGLSPYAGVRVWKVDTGKDLRHIDVQPGVSGQPVAALSPDGKTLALAAPATASSVSGAVGGRISLIDLATGKEIGQPEGHRAAVTVVAHSPDGKLLATGSSDRTIRLWDAASHKELRQLTGHLGAIAFLAFTPDGKNLFSASSDYNDKIITLWDVATGKEVRYFRGLQTGTTSSVGVTPDGKILGANGFDGLFRLYDVATKKELQAFKGRANAVAFSPDGKTVLFPGTDGVMRIWSVETGAELRQLPRGIAFIFTRFSPDGKYLAATAYDGIIRLYELSSGREVRQLGGQAAPNVAGQPVPIRRSGIAAFGFAPDGRTLVAAGVDNNVRVWELATGKERCSFAGHQGLVTSVSISPDGRRIASGSADSTTLIWDAMGLSTKPAELTAKEVEALWGELLAVEDGRKPFQAIRSLSASADQAVPFLKEHLQPTPGVDPRRIDQLIVDLDSAEFAVRRQAMEDLEKLGDLTEPALRKALESKPSLEVVKRLEELLQKLEGRVLAAEQVRTLRALEVLEHIGSAAAREVLEGLAKGAPGDLVTREAKASLERLAKYPK